MANRGQIPTNNSALIAMIADEVDFEYKESNRKMVPVYSNGKEHFSSNLSVLLQWSPYSNEELLLEQFDDIGQHGTKIIIYNLWLNDREDMELDFDSDVEDIRITADAKLIQTGLKPKPIQDQHITNLYRYSLRVYASILYLRLPQSFKIVLRGKEIEHHNIANDLIFPEFILYKPQIGINSEDAASEISAELQGVPDLIIGNYSDGNLVATLLAAKLGVTQCIIAHALEKTKYSESDIFWKKFDENIISHANLLLTF